MKKTAFIVPAIILLCAIAAYAMDIIPIPDKIVFDKEAFIKNRTEWNKLNIKDYSFNYNSMGFQIIDWIITVKDGKVASVVWREKEDKPLSLHNGKTIDKLFEEIEQHYGSGNIFKYRNSRYLERINVKYDPQYHFPAQISYGHHFNPNVMVDGNFSFEVRDFKKL